MAINHKFKLIFIHIPKTAGTSVEFALGMHDTKYNVGIERYLNQKKNFNYLFGGGLQHYNAKQIRSYIGRKKYSEYVKFSIVRNPYDRLVSFISSRNGKWESKEKLSKEQFNYYLSQSRRLIRLRSNPLLRPQVDYITIKGELAVDYILHFETLDEEIERLSSVLNMEIKLDQRMKSSHDNYNSYYDDYSIKLVNKIYKKDFDYFGYHEKEI